MCTNNMVSEGRANQLRLSNYIILYYYVYIVTEDGKNEIIFKRGDPPI